MKYTMQTRKTGALASTMAAGASSCTLAASTFGTPTGKQIITIDGDVSAKAADFSCTIAGTAITSMTLLNGPDVEHTSGATVWMGMVDEHYSILADTLDSGWLEEAVNETWVYASASTFTIASVDVTSKYRKGTKLRFKQGGGYKYAVVLSSAFGANTTVTIAVNTDYTIANSAITDNAYSYMEAPQGFPDWFSFTTTRAVSGGGTAPTYTATDVSKYSVKGNTCFWLIIWDNAAGGTAGAGAGNLSFTVPIANADYSDGRSLVGVGQLSESAGTIDSVVMLNDGSSTTIGIWLGVSLTRATGNDQSSVSRFISGQGHYRI